jgi:predicted ATPase
MQREVAKADGLTLIDEVENGLEPHRIRHLLRVMRGTDGLERHVLMTTHAPVVLGELRASELRVVRS